MKKEIRPLLLLLAGLLLWGSLFSQEDNKKDDDDSTQYQAAAQKVSLLRLRKSYTLGRGISLHSPAGSFNISQSIQTLYGVSTPNKNFTGLSSQFAINRARLSLFSSLMDKKIEFNLRLDFGSNYQSAATGARSFNNVLQEAYVSYTPTQAHSFNFGLRADYTDTRELRVEGENLGFIGRSALSGAFDAIFDY
ncbi:MAG TPA: porin, partial [Chitinophagaceae bacterium]